MPLLSLWPPASSEPNKGFGYTNRTHLCGPCFYVSPSLADTPLAAVSIFLPLGPDCAPVLRRPGLNLSSTLH